MIEPLEPWGLELKNYRPEFHIPGSSERCLSRSVVEDSNGFLWLLERIGSAQREKRIMIAENIYSLSESGLKRILAYQPDLNGEFVSEVMGLDWQLSPFCISDTLPRPSYIHDSLRGRELSDFLCQLRQKSLCSDLQNCFDYDLKEYISVLTDTVLKSRTYISERLSCISEKILEHLEEIDLLPKSFCHGDFHPLNVLWNGSNAEAVIDWEFSGIRPESYDMANLIGCAGFEHPEALTKNFVLEFISAMRKSELVEESIRTLPLLVIALRFAWLSEWLRKNDNEMIQMELDYMDLLMDNTDKLQKVWMAAFFA